MISGMTARLSLSSLVAAAALFAHAGCGGCGYDLVPATLSTNPGGCVTIHASVGWGCHAGNAALDGDNDCPAPLTIAAAGTTLAADLIVAPGESFSVAVMTMPAPASTFALDLGGQALTLTVDWAADR